MTEIELPHLRTKDKVLQLIAAHGVPIHNIDELRDLWGPYPPHARELTRVLWDLQKQGEIKFNEIKAGRDSLLTKIRLSRGIQTTAFRSNESHGRHSVGRDMTDPQNHHWVAKGGPIEKVKIPMEVPMTTETYVNHGPKPKNTSSWSAYVNKINPDRARPLLPLIAQHVDRPVAIQKVLGYSSPRITTLVSRAEQLGWVTKEKVERNGTEYGGVRLHLTELGRQLSTEAFSDEGSRGPKPRSKKEEARTSDMEAHDIQSDTPTQYPAADTPQEYSEPVTLRPTMNTTSWPRIIDVVELEKYPLISELMGKEERLLAYEAAAKLLEGFDADLALSLLEKIQITPLESEVIIFIRSLR